LICKELATVETGARPPGNSPTNHGIATACAAMVP
jgi:hypothetical protein